MAATKGIDATASTKRLAWAYGCAKAFSEEELRLLGLLRDRMRTERAMAESHAVADAQRYQAVREMRLAEESRADERAKVVAWLRGHAFKLQTLVGGEVRSESITDATEMLADMIERGEHLDTTEDS